MRPVYENITLAPGANKPRLCSLLIAPIEWLQGDVVVDYNSGMILEPPVLNNGWLELKLAPESYDYEEKPKSNRAGQYYEITIAGTANQITPEIQLVLNTLRFHQLVVRAKDKHGNIKYVGTRESGAVFQFANANAALQKVDITLSYDSEYPAPYILGAAVPGGGGDGGGTITNGIVDFDNTPIIDWDNVQLDTL